MTQKYIYSLNIPEIQNLINFPIFHFVLDFNLLWGPSISNPMIYVKCIFYYLHKNVQ